MSNRQSFMGFTKGKALFFSENEKSFSIIYKKEELPPWQFVLPVVIVSILLGFSAPLLINAGAKIIPNAVMEISKILEVRHD